MKYSILLLSMLGKLNTLSEPLLDTSEKEEVVDTPPAKVGFGKPLRVDVGI